MINRVGLEIVEFPVPHVPRETLCKKLENLNLTETFSTEFGIQTSIPEGLYAWDVEECFERIFGGRKQKLFQWD
jgi:hypothetical protein